MALTQPGRAFAWAAILSSALVVGAGCNGGSSSTPAPLRPTPTPTPTPVSTAFPVATQQKIQSAIDAWFSKFKAPGVVVGIWVPNKGTYVSAQGLGNLATGAKMQLDDHFRIGSITKTVTVTQLLRMADQRLVSLDDPVSKYVSYVPNGQNITLRMLANMTSGLFSYTRDAGFVDTLQSHPHKVWTPIELVNIGLAHPPEFAPGKGWDYCNTNTVLLGIILQQVLKEPIQDAFAAQIFSTLHLSETSWPTDIALPNPYAHGITEQTLDGSQADATHWSPTWGFTAGQIISDLDDLKTYVFAYTTGTLVSPAMQKERLTWVTLPPNTPEHKYGLGIGFDHGWLGHTGELPGYNCGAFYLPALNATMIIETNSDIPVGRDNPVPALVHDLAKIVTPGNVPGGSDG